MGEMEAAIAALPAKKEALQENGWPQGILQFTHGAASASAVAVSASSCPVKKTQQAPRKPPRPERTTMMAMAMAEDGSASWFQYSEEMLLPMPPTPFCTTPAVAAVCALWPRVPRT
ncbi:Os04g0289025 [Oryza sativa Japonica Group]|uniref:Os04g0289025 protein n=1 Tax=Oryza sativa subsp. japonica TaxID=39947 RepID=A0A0P0W8S2_ORYSJ|nr:Os04g0289025 [Oryza sativa Japonica Group]